MTLLSLLVAMGIVGILASISVPGFTHLLHKSDLQQARHQLMLWQTEQLRYRLGNGEYASAEKLSVPTKSAFTFTVSTASDTVYLLEASREQALQDGCDTLTVNHTGAVTPPACWR